MLRTLVTALVLSLFVVLVGPLGMLAAWLSGSARPLYAIAFPVVRLALWLAGIRTQVRGKARLDSDTTYLFLVNHQSNIDPPLVFAVIGRRLRALAKASVFRLPVFGSVMRMAEFIPVQRDDRERAVRAVDQAALALRDGHDFLVFPEGTRSRDGRLLPLKKGPFVMAIKAQVDVVPIVLQGTRDMMRKGSMRIHPGVATLDFLEPVSTLGLRLSDRHALRDRVQDLMSAVLDRDADAP